MANGLIALARTKIEQALTPLDRRAVVTVGTWSAGLPAQSSNGNSAALPVGMKGAIPLRGEAPALYQSTGTTVRIRGFERHPVVMACVRAITDISAAIPLQAYKKRSDGSREIVTTMPSTFDGQTLVDAPSPFLSAQRLRALTITHYLVYGNAFWFLERAPSLKVPNPNPPLGIRIVHPEDIMTVYVDQRGYPLWYLWRDTLGYTHTSPVTDLMHFRDLSAKGLVFGYPRAASALNDIIGDDEASQHVRQVVTNAGMPTAVMLMDAEANEQDARLAEAAFQEKMVARGERGRVAFMGGVKDVKVLGFTLRELEFPDLRRVAREDICAAFGVDPRMIGIGSATNDGGLSGIQFKEARTRLVQQTIEPLLIALESELDLWLAPEFGDVYYRFDPDVLAALVEDHDATSKRVIAEVGATLRTVEEGREALDLPADYRTTDTLAPTLGVQLVPVVIAMNPEPAPTSAADGTVPADEGAQSVPGDAAAGAAGATDKNPNAPAATGTPKEAKPAEAKRGGLRPRVTPVVTATISQWDDRATLAGIVTRGAVLSPEVRRMIWAHFDQRATNEEAPYRRTALMLFGEERATIARLFERQIAAFDAHPSDDPAAFMRTAKRQCQHMYKSGGEIEHRWADRYHTLIAGTVAKGAEHTMSGLRSHRSERRASDDPPGKPKPTSGTPAATIDILPDFDLHNPDVQAAIRKRASALAGHVGQTTGDAVTGALSIGMQEGMSLREMAALVDKTAFGGSAGFRSRLIARTESGGALNLGQFMGATASGAIQKKSWLTQSDDDVRESHAELDGVEIGVDEAFDNGCSYPGDEAGDAEETINCFLPGTLVSGNIVAAIRSRYHGPARELVTKSGRRLSVTANHPVMTAEGLRPAGAVRKGDQLLCDRREIYSEAMPANAHDDERPSRVEDVFTALRVGSPTIRRHLRSDDLHGDARWVNGHVEIVRTDCMLLADGNAVRPQEFGEGVLKEMPPSEPFHVGFGAQDLRLHGIDVASAAAPSAAALALDGGAVCLEDSPLEPFGIALSPDLDAALLETAKEEGTIEPGFVRQMLERYAGLVALDDVVEVRDFDYAGHVYDLEVSAPNLIVGAGIVTSNCRCTLLYMDE